MARYSGGPVTHRALTGPRMLGWMRNDPDAWKGEILSTLACVKDIRGKCRHDRTSGRERWTKDRPFMDGDRGDPRRYASVRVGTLARTGGG